METKYKVWDVERKSYWPEQFTLIELAASHRFPSNAAQFYVIEPVTPAPDADNLADDLALAWISKHTKIEIDSPAYRELVRAFLQMGRTPAPDAALVEALRPFAACAEMWLDDDPDWILHRSRQNVPGKPNLHITVGDLLAARAALASVEQGGR